MARTPTTADVFNAVAEASRRDLLDALGDGEATVSELVDRLGLSQPQVSKHLGVLRAVGLVSVRVDGRHRWYRVNGPALKPVHDWVRTFERTWNTRPRPARRPRRRAQGPGERTMSSTTRNRHGSAVITQPSDTEIVITRVFDAPAELLFKAYTTPDLVKQWWSFGTAEWLACEVDLRVGGRWRFVTRDEGMEVGFHGEYREIDPPHRLVSTEVFEGARSPTPTRSRPSTSSPSTRTTV